jgi:hypothetical protein
MKMRLAVVIVAIAPVLMAAQAMAQSPTWVSGVGSDANPCSRTAPCQTFAGAIAKTATSGVVNCLDAGNFGNPTITKSITLDCTGVARGVYATGTTSGITINASNIVVVLKGLTISGPGTSFTSSIGINFVNGRVLHIIDSHVDGFATGINFAPPTGSNARLTAANSSFNDNLSVGIDIVPSGTGIANVVLNNVQADTNFVGVRVLAPAGARTRLAIWGSSLSTNAAFGLSVDGSGAPATISIQDSVFASNGTTGIFASGANATVALCCSLVTLNTTGLSFAAGAQLLTFGNSSNNLNNSSNGAPSGPVGSPSTVNGQQ